MKAVYRIDWTEYERGWGQRPDGYQLCIDKKAADKVIEEHVAAEKKRNPSGAVPDYYFAPSQPRLVEVDLKTYKKVQKDRVIWGK